MIDLVYDIPDSEKRALNLPIHIVSKSGTNELKVSEDKGNEPLALSAIHDKIDDALELLVAYSAQLRNMDDKRFTKAKMIKNELVTGGNLRLFLSNVLRDETVPWDRRLELAVSMFYDSSGFIFSALSKDSKHQKTIVEPIQEASTKLNEIMNEIRLNRELIKSKEEMERRYSQKNSIMSFRALSNHYNVMCNFCTRTNHNDSLVLAIRHLKHQDDCPFKQDHILPLDQLAEPDILSHYAREKPLAPSKEQDFEAESIEKLQNENAIKSTQKNKPQRKGRKPKY